MAKLCWLISLIVLAPTVGWAQSDPGKAFTTPWICNGGLLIGARKLSATKLALSLGLDSRVVTRSSDHAGVGSQHFSEDESWEWSCKAMQCALVDHENQQVLAEECEPYGGPVKLEAPGGNKRR